RSRIAGATHLFTIRRAPRQYRRRWAWISMQVQRSREYLTDREDDRLLEAAKQNHPGHPDATAILVAYRHGLRTAELVAPRGGDIALATGRLHVRRAKSRDASVHPISARESRALRKLLREAQTSPYVFISARAVRSRISAHGCQGGRVCEIHLPRAFPHAAACLRVQARQRRPRHSRHPSLSRPPIDHVHGPLHGLDAEPVQNLLEGLTFQASSGRSGDHLSGARPSECAYSCRHHLLVCRVTRQCNHATITDRRF